MELKKKLEMKWNDDLNPDKAAGGRQRMTLHCKQCNAVLADSFGVCGEVACLGSIMCIRVTKDVIVSDAMKSGYKGEMINCIYSSLKCRGCGCVLGKVIHSAPSRLAAVRSIFLLSKANIRCFILGSSSMVKASAVSFDQRPLKENIIEVKQQFETLLEALMSHTESRGADVSSTSELSSYNSRGIQL
ncbi:protein Mis18-beta [Mugil cephalus]|uniref:protein Mis18-beta n=1 Tax=Mugil cephalus TaxID=48193 RepID=UPI001FB74BD8|nr:protein Mis18-beta [Mugil cephalus]